jgi:hypothetical protein
MLLTARLAPAAALALFVTDTYVPSEETDSELAAFVWPHEDGIPEKGWGLSTRLVPEKVSVRESGHCTRLKTRLVKRRVCTKCGSKQCFLQDDQTLGKRWRVKAASWQAIAGSGEGFGVAIKSAAPGKNSKKWFVRSMGEGSTKCFFGDDERLGARKQSLEGFYFRVGCPIHHRATQ